MARRRKKKGSRKKNKAIPLAVVLPPAFVVYNRVSTLGLSAQSLGFIMKDITGYSPAEKIYSFDSQKAFVFGEIAGVIVHKAATKFGVNRAMKKLTMGYLEI